MNNTTRFTPTALAAFVVLAGALYSCASGAPIAPATVSQTATPAPTPGPTATPPPTAAPSPTAVPSGTPATTGPALTETFASDRYGITISYPAGWSVQRASKPWTGGPFFFQDPVGDFLYETELTDHLFLALASHRLGLLSPDMWTARLLDLEDCSGSEPVVIDGAEGVIGTDCGVALVPRYGHGYFIWLYVSADDPKVGEVHNRAWFDQVLATVQLDPPEIAGPP